MNNMLAGNLGHIYYVSTISPYLFLLKGLWVIGIPLIVLNFVFYFFGKDMNLFKNTIPSFNIFFFGINAILSINIILINVFKEHNMLIGSIIFISILATSGFYNRMIKAGKAERKK